MRASATGRSHLGPAERRRPRIRWLALAVAALAVAGCERAAGSPTGSDSGIPESCGNGLWEPEHGEECDGSDLGGQGCVELGYVGGSLSCYPVCILDRWSCHRCGDGACNLGSGDYENRLVCAEDCGQPFVDVAPGKAATADAHTCALLGDGTVWCWGANGFGQLGDGSQAASGLPVRVTSLPPARAVTTGAHHSCALLQDGGVRCWGLDADGQLGDGASAHPGCSADDDCSAVPVTVGGLGPVAQLSAGPAHTCAVLEDGAARCWGQGEDGQLGDGLLASSAAPVAVIGLPPARKIAGGGVAPSGHTCAVAVDGSLWCWGRNTEGQVGHGLDAPKVELPAAVVGLADASDVAAGGYHSCAALGSGHLWCWGAGEQYQLGAGADATGAPLVARSNVPVPVFDDYGRSRSVTAGIHHSCARADGETILCWGTAPYGGHGSDPSQQPSLATPEWVGGFPTTGGSGDLPVPIGASHLATGGHHGCAILYDGSLWCWGRNSAGQLGRGDEPQDDCAGEPCSWHPVPPLGL